MPMPEKILYGPGGEVLFTSNGQVIKNSKAAQAHRKNCKRCSRLARVNGRAVSVEIRQVDQLIELHLASCRLCLEAGQDPTNPLQYCSKGEELRKYRLEQLGRLWCDRGRKLAMGEAAA